jgi:hypothetical protein
MSACIVATARSSLGWPRITTGSSSAKLSSALPAGRKLYAIHDRWAVLDKERPRTMRRLRRTPATSIDGVVGKLQVVVAATDPEECSGAHRLLKATINDLRMLRGS